MLGQVVDKLCRWGQPVKPRGYDVGPSFVRLKVEPREQTDVNKVRKKDENLQLHLKLDHRPLIAVQAGYISVDVQRPDSQVVELDPLLQAAPPKSADRPAFPVGVDVAGRPSWLDLGDAANCHLLIAGMTGSGKSEFLKAMIAALALRLEPQRLQLILIDPKQVTFNFRGESPYLHCPVATDIDDALPLANDCVEEMERRYTLLHERGLENIDQLTGDDRVPHRVLILDEFADLMLQRATKKELELLVQRIGNKARAAGIHLVLATQRPDANVVNPQLRNTMSRICFKVSSEKDSNVVLENPDAAYLLGRGDLLWKTGAGLLRLQSPLITKTELSEALRLH
jgi:S-DNA-T family DNA segregation ATPase FtsK/SpoIIIE